MTELANHVQQLLPHTRFEKVTDGIAVAGTASPFWLPWLQSWSEIAAYALPIGGLIWLAVQVIAKILVTRKILRGGQK